MTASPRVAAIVLAAGASLRMGTAKPLVIWRGRTFVAHVIETLRTAGCDPVLVVEGAHTLPDAAIVGAQRVVHPAWESGPLSSLQAGLWALEDPAVAVVVATVDRPHLAVVTVRALVDGHRTEPGAVWQPTHGGHRGHPVLLPAALQTRVLALAATATLRELLEQVDVTALRRTAEVADPAVLDNIDSPEALALLPS